MNRSQAIAHSGGNVYSAQKAAMLVFLTFAMLLLGMNMVYAVGPIDTPMGWTLCQIVGMTYGNMGRAVATLAVAIVGVGATLGKVSWGLAMMVGVGVAIVMNSGTVVLSLGGGICP